MEMGINIVDVVKYISFMMAYFVLLWDGMSITQDTGQACNIEVY
jgi:hypothetical protein